MLSLILHRLYGGLKVGIFKYWNLVYSHMISILGVNLFSYVQVVLFDKKMHNPTAIIVMTVVDLAIVMIWAFAFKNCTCSFSEETSVAGLWKESDVSFNE